MEMRMNKNEFIEGTTKDGKRVIIQVKNIFNVLETENGCIIQSIGSQDNYIVITENYGMISQKIIQK